MMRWPDVSFSRKTLREFAALWIVFFGALAIWQACNTHHQASVVLAIVALTVGPAGLIEPNLVKPIYTVWMVLVFPLAWLVSLVVLAAVYFLLLTPIAWWIRCRHGDPLRRQFPAPEETCWEERPESKLARYFRQF